MSQKKKPKNPKTNKKETYDSVERPKDIIDELLEEDWESVRNLDIPKRNKKQRITGVR